MKNVKHTMEGAPPPLRGWIAPSPPSGSGALEEFDFFKPFFGSSASSKEALHLTSFPGDVAGSGLPVGFSWASPSNPARFNMFLRRTEDAYARALNSVRADAL